MPNQAKRPSTRLTAKFIECIRRPGSDGGRGSNGLHLVVSATGAKSYRQRLWFHGRAYNIGLGSARHTTLADARHAAADNYRRLKAGEDPRYSKSKSFDAVAEQVAKKKADDGKHPGKLQREFRQRIRDYCQPIAKMPVDAVTTRDVHTCLKAV